jgi:hypothetical protein
MSAEKPTTMIVTMTASLEAKKAARLSVAEVCYFATLKFLIFQVASAFDVNPQHGLSAIEVERRRAYAGHNEFDVGEVEPLWKKYAEQVSIYSVYAVFICCFCSSKIH